MSHLRPALAPPWPTRVRAWLATRVLCRSLGHHWVPEIYHQVCTRCAVAVRRSHPDAYLPNVVPMPLHVRWHQTGQSHPPQHLKESS